MWRIATGVALSVTSPPSEGWAVPHQQCDPSLIENNNAATHFFPPSRDPRAFLYRQLFARLVASLNWTAPFVPLLCCFSNRSSFYAFQSTSSVYDLAWSSVHRGWQIYRVPRPSLSRVTFLFLFADAKQLTLIDVSCYIWSERDRRRLWFADALRLSKTGF